MDGCYAIVMQLVIHLFPRDLDDPDEIDRVSRPRVYSEESSTKQQNTFCADNIRFDPAAISRLPVASSCLEDLLDVVRAYICVYIYIYYMFGFTNADVNIMICDGTLFHSIPYSRIIKGLFFLG